MKKILIVLAILALVLSFAACEIEKPNMDVSPEVLEEARSEDIMIWTDEETGVQYIIYSKNVLKGGMGGITPRLNADGTLCIGTEDGEQK